MPKTTAKKSTTRSSTTAKTGTKRPAAKRNTSKPTKQELERNYKIKYELKMISLAAVTLFMMISLYTSAVGVIGHAITQTILGLFSYVGYSLPIVFFILVFVRLNPNFRPAKVRVTTSLILIMVGLLLLSTLVAYDGIEKQKLILRDDYLASSGVQLAYELGTELKGGGVFGDILTISTIKLIGIFGAYMLIIITFLIGFIIFTKISLQDLWEMKKRSNEERKQLKAQERAIEASIVENKLNVKNQKLEEKSNDKIENTWNTNGSTAEQGFLSELESMRRNKKKDVKSFDYDSYEKQNDNLKNKTDEIEASNSKATGTQPKVPSKVQQKKQPNEEQAQIIADPYAEPVKVSPKVENNVNDEIKQSATNSEIKSNSIDFFDHNDKKTSNNRNQTSDKSVDKMVEKSPEKIKESDIDPQTRQTVNDEIKQNTTKVIETYHLPPLELLREENVSSQVEDKNEYIEMAKLLEDTLNNFNVDAKVVSVKRGPSITMFEVQPSPGVKVSKIVGLSDDIALNLATSHVRIAPIPGKVAIGIEVPNKVTSMVRIREVITSAEFKKQKSKLTIGLGKDISGNAIIGDLASMPHLLIAGATGSGKSVCVNTIISSILFNARPDEVKFLMIDPKVVELSNYNGIPHLILPVVTDPKKASIALNWAVNEMTRRYKLFAEQVVRDMKSYNKKAELNGLEILPQIVVIIDELADLMMVAPNVVEDAICRLAQMARAAGIHLIVATQRPSVDVITGLIKANIPSRIAFSVSSSIDSRTIIDMGGAEKLLGKGDMLYYPIGASKPKRAQGAFMSDEEVEALVDYIKNQDHEVSYNEEILDEVQSIGSNLEDVDEHLEDAINFVVESGQASASLMQRRFRVGYNRAARLVDAMEERGIIGPSRGSKPREVLITVEELSAITGQGNLEEEPDFTPDYEPNYESDFEEEDNSNNDEQEEF
ncbi:DNA translocase FtsK [Fusibacter bizertensis]|uniref:DNA translocase FtsK n=1 Tax=Fusibacter bizertensis TaxID=1488331 RepID=A0ABT6N845_9FIRM|nr:DNA translocase FtsK [Fusibacter bizertensis]MDH8676576.1 DNA translocase FtsK [Fusibacter bizertensis]